MEEGLKTVLKSEREIGIITNIIYNQLGNPKINIVFKKENNIITFSTEYKSKKIEIKYMDLKIISLKVN
jgi:hypothetical protein